MCFYYLKDTNFNVTVHLNTMQSKEYSVTRRI